MNVFQVDRKHEEIEAARTLLTEYESEIGFELRLLDFDGEIASLPGRYAPQTGMLLVVFDGGNPAACVAMAYGDDGVAELRHLFVRRQYRCLGLGKQLAHVALRRAKQMGFHTVRINALRTMKPALALYHGFGFKGDSCEEAADSSTKSMSLDLT